MNLRARAVSKRGALALTAGSVAAAMGVATLGPIGAQASSHREAPVIDGMPEYDNTDVYAFRSPERQNTVTLVANWHPFEEPAGGPNFYQFAQNARYNIKIDNDGDAKADIVYRWKFKTHIRDKNTFLYANGPVTSLRDENLNVYQTYRLTRIKNGYSKVLVKNRRVAPSNVGQATMPNYQFLRNRATTPIGAGRSRMMSFAGQAEDPFFVELRVFDLLYGGDLSETGDDTLRGFNVNSVALQVPRNQLVKGGNVERNPVIGVWSTTDKRGVNGKYRQVSRLGLPLVNEVVIPLKDKNKYNRSRPVNDVENFASYIVKPELPRLVEAVYGVPAPDEPRNDLLALVTGLEGLNMPRNVVPSDMLRLNVTTPVESSPNRMGALAGDVQGFPNGRRLGDDVLDISVRVLEGALLPADQQNALAKGFSDGVDGNDRGFGDIFPYLALPYSGSNSEPHEDDPTP